MSEQELEKRKGCNKPVVLFFVFAIVIVAALFIIGIVTTCSTEHEEKVEEQTNIGMVTTINEANTPTIFIS